MRLNQSKALVMYPLARSQLTLVTRAREGQDRAEIRWRICKIYRSVNTDIIIQVPKKRVSSASESIRGTRKVSPGPKSADSRDQE